MNFKYLTACIIFLFTATFAGAQQGTIHGKVLSSDGKPVPYVNVTIKEQNKSTVTNEDGYFEFRTNKDCNCTLLVSFVGLNPEEKKIVIRNGEKKEVSFMLHESAGQLDEVIVRSHKSLNNIPVSAGKIAIDPMDLPQSIAVISQGVIRDQQALRLSDVIRNVNGVYLKDVRGGTQENFSARGYSFSSSNMFKNGSRVNSGVMPELSSLEKVEILKGSTAILYGNVAPGGIINMVTKQPRFNAGAEVSLRAGSYGLYKPAFDVYGPLSKSVAYRVNGTFETANSYRDNVTSKRYYINPSVLTKFGENTTLLIQGDYLKHDFTPDFGIGTLNNITIPGLSRSAFLGAPWQYAHTQQTTASATLKHNFSENWKLNATASYQNYNRDYYAIERIQADSLGNWKRPLGRTNTNERYFIAQADLTGNFKTLGLQHLLLAGIDADNYNISNYAYNQPAYYDTINILDPSKYQARTDIPEASRIRRVQTRTNRVGAYVQDLVSLSDKVKLLAGLRYSYQKALAPDTFNLQTSSQSVGKSQADAAFSPRVGLVYRPGNTTSFFLSYSNSFAVNSGTDINGNALSPSIIDQYEAGMKNEILKGLLSANLTVYRIVNHNFAQVAPYTATGAINTNTTIKELTGQTTSDGVEIDLTAHPLNGFDVIAGYSYNYMRFTKTGTAKGNYIQGERLVNTPAHTANASVFYNFTSKRLKGFKVGATGFYTGNRLGGYNNTLGQSQQFSRLIPVKGFTTIDVSAGYSYKQISLLAKISNITNVLNYNIHDNYSINPIAPRQYAATVAYRF